MRIFLDECVDRRLAREFGDLEIATARDAGWLGKKNGELPSLAEAAFDIFVTVDRNLPYQNSIAGRRIAIVSLVAQTESLSELSSLVPKLRGALPALRAGSVTIIE